jgi:hypothetical protein
VAEVEQKMALEHPQRRGYPSGMEVDAIAHRSSLSTGRGRKTRSAAVFFNEARAPVAGGGPVSGWRERELGSTFHGRKSGKRGLGFRSPWKSSRRRRRPDSDGGALRQRRSAPDTDDSVVGTSAREVRRGDDATQTGGGAVGTAVGTPASGPDNALKASEWRGMGTWQPRGDGALTGGPGVGNGG